jgi:molybdenum cofactor biosynthesis enzyme MoaA
MTSIQLGGREIPVKDYECSSGSGYLPKAESRLSLYVDLTDVCNGHCPFCINPGRKEGESPFSLIRFRHVLEAVREKVSSVSLTGGEPLLHRGLADAALEEILQVFGHSVMIDLVTNGSDLNAIRDLKHLADLDSVHISRHRTDDAENSRIMGVRTAGWGEIMELINSMEDPGKIVLNCVLMKGGVESLEEAAVYLEKAAAAGVQNVSFIGMSLCNEYCRRHYVDPRALIQTEDSRFRFWNRYHDHDFCSCSSGSYEAEARGIRFYFRCMGTGRPSYARQLVYTEDNRLLAGFGGEEIIL